MRTLANEQHFRRASNETTNTYAKSGLRQSARVLIENTGLHPNLAAGFHHVSRARQGSFVTWKRLKRAHKLVAMPKFYGKLASTTAATGCPCCNNDSVADSLGHFIFECSNITLKSLRGKLGIDSLATQLTADVSRQQERRNNGNADDADNNNNNASTLPPPIIPNPHAHRYKIDKGYIP